MKVNCESVFYIISVLHLLLIVLQGLTVKNINLPWLKQFFVSKEHLPALNILFLNMQINHEPERIPQKLQAKIHPR